MELTQLRRDVNELTKRVGEVITILGGSASYDFKGMRADVRDLKTDSQQMKADLEKFRREYEDEKRKRSFLWIKMDTIPQKVAAAVTFVILILTAIGTIKDLLTPVQ